MILNEDQIEQIKGDHKNIYRQEYFDGRPEESNGWNIQVSIGGYVNNAFVRDGDHANNAVSSFKFAKLIQDELLKDQRLVRDYRDSKRPNLPDKCVHYALFKCRICRRQNKNELTMTDKYQEVTCASCKKNISAMKKAKLI